MEHKVTVEGIDHLVTDEMLAEILCIAVSGGIDYWADVISYNTGENRGHDKAALLVDEGGAETARPYQVDISTVLRGVRAVMDQPPANESKSALIATYYMKWTWLRDAIEDPEDGMVMVDADVADMVVQFALFGEEQFG